MLHFTMLESFIVVCRLMDVGLETAVVVGPVCMKFMHNEWQLTHVELPVIKRWLCGCEILRRRHATSPGVCLGSGLMIPFLPSLGINGTSRSRRWARPPDLSRL